MSSSILELEVSTVTPSRPHQRPVRLSLIAVVLGVLGAAVSFAGSWVPSFWGDEAATVMSAERPLATLWPELGRVDAVHGTYYLLMHFWIDLFGASELSVRLPSALAVGVAVAGVVVLANLLFSRRIALVAGIVMLLLPRVTLMGMEGRSYAMSAAIAVWLSVVLVVLLRRDAAGGRLRRALPWVGYAAFAAFGIYLFLYLVMLVGIHALVVLSSRDARLRWRAWLAAAASALTVALPVIYFSLSQSHQIHFLARRGYATLNHVLSSQWFGDHWFAVPAWIALIGGVIVMLMRWRRSTVLVLGWLVLPTVALLVGNALISPMYNLRYLSFCTPAVAITIAVGVSALRHNWMRVVAVALLVAACIPSYIAEREPFSKDRSIVYPNDSGSDLREAAAAVGANAKPGDGVVFDETVRPSRKPRLALHLYPQDFAGLTDLTLQTPYYELPGLWDRVAPITAANVGSTRTVWAIELIHATTPPDVLKLEQLGYAVTKRIPISRTVVYELTRETP